MTTTFDSSRYQRALARWRMLAEARLEHMAELYESGRWRRYYDEEQFVAIVRETTACVETWRKLAPNEATVVPLFTMPDGKPLARTPPPPSPFTEPMVGQLSVA
jgi:uncharacterized repeat protein (TIGR03809 family)